MVFRPLIDYCYFRHPEDRWEEDLKSLYSAGFRELSVPVSWRAFEDGAPPLSPLCELASELGFALQLEVGPLVGCQEDHQGLPDRIASSSNMHFLDGEGRAKWFPGPMKAFRIPSFASDAFLQQVRRFWSALAKSVQVPIEAGKIGGLCLSSFVHLHCLGPFERDHREEAEAWWQEFLSETEEKLDADKANSRLLLPFFAEEYERRCREALTKIARESGLAELPIHSALDVPSAQPLPGAVLERRSRGGRAVAGFSLGAPAYWPTPSENAQRNLILRCVAGGPPSFRFSDPFPRERFAARRDEAEAIPSWLRDLLSLANEPSLGTLRRGAKVAVIHGESESRFASADRCLDAVPDSLLQFLPGLDGALSLDESAREHRIWFASILRGLEEANISYRLVHERSLHTIGEEIELLILPTVRRVDGATWAGLHALAATGKQILIGPHRPSQDEWGRELGEDAGLPPHCGIFEEELVRSSEAMREALLSVAPSEKGPRFFGQGLRSERFFDKAAPGQELVFVWTTEKSGCAATFQLPSGTRLREVVDEGAEVSTDILLEPEKVRVFRLFQAEASP